MPSSIIAHETEVSVIKKLAQMNCKIFIIGIFANVMKEVYNIKNCFVVPGEPETFFLENDLNKEFLNKFFSGEKKKLLWETICR